MKKTTHYCDICECVDPSHKDEKLPVIFTTEQTEGRHSKPYLDDIIIDICSKCHNHILEGNFIFASGAQGHNKYFFKKTK